MKIAFSPPDITEAEIAAVGEAMRSGWITTGPKTKQLEHNLEQYLCAQRVVCLNSATACMELSLRLLGVGEGDEVITSAYTYTASASVAEHVGAKVVLVDCKPDSVLIDPQKVAAAITARTKAVIPIDIGGVPADYDGIYSAIEGKKHLFSPNSELQKQLGRAAVIGDCAHSLGAVYKGKNVADMSDFACFSFHAVKNLTTAEGGAVAFRKIGNVSCEELYKQYMLYSLHGQNKDALAKTQLGSWEYDIVIPGYKCNMTDILAAIGIVQLERYPDLIKRRVEMVKRYNELFFATGIRPMQHSGDGFFGSHHAYITNVDGVDADARNEIIEEMAKNGVSANVHYKPLPMMTAYKAMGYDIADFPNAYRHFENEITMPLHTLLTDAEIDYVAETAIAALKKIKGGK
ncbi:MAG: DegT/DnrJ/EryC1/StrS family aminotransferase [Oscillospiraceae bacterium]